MKKRWTLSTAAAGAAVAGMLDGETRANDFSFSPSVFLQVSFGNDWDIGLGVDLRTSLLFEPSSCFVDGPQAGVGVFAQGVVLFRGGGFLVGSGLHGGAQARRDGASWDIELGWAWRSERQGVVGGHGFQLGVDVSSLPWSAAGRATLIHADGLWEPEGHVAGGFRAPGVFGADGSFCIDGRPQRTGDGLVLGRVIARPNTGRRLLAPADAVRAAVGRAWVEAARAEAASVPAFVGLARDLTQAGAPQVLVQRALVAAGDEVRHARVCAAMAGKALGCAIAAEMPAVNPVLDVSRIELLKRLGAESMRDGVIGEGAAALEAAAGSKRARDVRVRRALATIATEEKGHASLAADVVAWAVAEGGRPVHDAVVAAVAAASDKLTTASQDGRNEHDGVDSADGRSRWKAAGRLLRAEQRALYGFALDKARTRWSL